MSAIFKRGLPDIQVPHHKETAACHTVQMPDPPQVVIPMSQHIGAICEPLVSIGQQVLVGQCIGRSQAKVSACIHASVSGTVIAIEDFVTTQGAISPAVTIESDGKHTLDPGLTPPRVETVDDLYRAVYDSGLVGLGGAGFPSHIKVDPGNPNRIHTLIVNAAECEPFITSDYRAIIERSDDLMRGIRTVVQHLEIERCIIGIEDNKPKAVDLLRQVLSHEADGRIKLHVLPSRYPEGAEKVLIFKTTGVTVEEGRLPADYGLLVMNVSSLTFLGGYLRTGVPLVSKVVTVAGSAIADPQNVIAPLGAPYRSLIDFCGGYVGELGEVFMGGPMMGINIYDDSLPVLKNNNAIIALSKADRIQMPESNCIRCGRCVAACPERLLPAMIDRAVYRNDVEALRNFKVNLCLECGCCAYVCPAKRQLVLSNRLGKRKLREADMAKKAKEGQNGK